MGCVHKVRTTLQHYTRYHVAVFFLTFMSYSMLHATRKSFSNVKTTMSAEWTPYLLNHSSAGGGGLTPRSLWMTRSLFTDMDDAETFMGTLDASFMFAYAAGLFVSGFIADRSDMRLMLSAGMVLTSLMVFLYGCVFEWLHWYRQPAYLLVWILNGLLQSMGWPCVVAVMGNWFGKGSRGLVLGVWSACASVGNILGSVLVSAVLDYGYDRAFLVTACVLLGVAIINLLGLVPSPLEVGLPLSHNADEDDDDDGGSVGKDQGHNVQRHDGVVINSIQPETILDNVDGRPDNGRVPSDSAVTIAVASEHDHRHAANTEDGSKLDRQDIDRHHGLAETNKDGASGGRVDRKQENGHIQDVPMVEICLHDENTPTNEDRPPQKDCSPENGDVGEDKNSPAENCPPGRSSCPSPQQNRSTARHSSESEDPTGGQDREEDGEKPHPVNFLTALLLPGVVPYSLCYAFLKLVNYSFFFWLPFYLSNAYGMAETVADRLSIWYDLGGVVGGTVAGFLSDRLGTRTVVVMPMLLLAVPLLFVYGMTGVAASLTINALLLFVLGSLIGGVANLISAAIAADLGRQKALQGNPQALSTVTGILDGTGSTGAALGQVAVPHLQVLWGWRTVFYLFMVCTALTALCIVRIFWAEVRHLIRRFRSRQ